MTAGPGKYDDVCTVVKEVTDADMVMVVVLRGRKGSGFSIQTTDLDLTRQVPEMLRHIADQIEEDMRT